MLRVSIKPFFSSQQPTDEFFAGPLMTMRPEQLTISQFVELTNLAEQATASRPDSISAT